MVSTSDFHLSHCSSSESRLRKVHLNLGKRSVREASRSRGWCHSFQIHQPLEVYRLRGFAIWPASIAVSGLWKTLTSPLVYRRRTSKLNAGFYGVCEECGIEIAVSRLIAIPCASRCRECEQGHGLLTQMVRALLVGQKLSCA